MRFLIGLWALIATPAFAQPPQEPDDPSIPNWGGAIKFENNEAPVSPRPLPYSPVVEANGVLYLAGHIGRDPETRALAGEIQAETKRTLENIGATLESVGATFADVVRCQVFLADIEDFAAMNDVYRTFFPMNPPARSTMAVKDIVIGAKIEIECTAVRGHGAEEE